MSETVWIENTQPRIIHLPEDVSKKGEHCVGRGNGKPIVPSIKDDKGATQFTQVDKKFWDRKKSNAVVKTWLKMGWLKVHDSTTPGTEMPDSLAKYNARTAITLVEGEDNVDLVKQWSELELRDDVAAALVARIAALEAVKKKGQ